MKKIIKSFLVLLIAVLLMGCTKEEQPPVDELPNDAQVDENQQGSTKTMAEGEIKEIYNAEKDITGFFITDGKTDDVANKYRTAYVTITDETKIYDHEGNEISADILEVGMYVEVVFYGSIAESYPPQGSAGTVTIIK